jgi:hypothetical protein
VTFFTEEYLEQQRRLLGEHNFNREYLGVPLGATTSPFSWDLYERATQIHVPLVQPGPAFQPPAERQAEPIANPFKRLRASGVVR